MSSRLHLPFAALSDDAMRFTNALRLPPFMVDGVRLIKRLTIIAQGRRIETVFYPIVRPEENVSDVIACSKRIQFDGRGRASTGSSRPYAREGGPPFQMSPKIATASRHVPFEDLGVFHAVLTLACFDAN